jgi:hypothetical protein
VDVIIDCNRRTAIVVSRGRKLLHVVPLEEGELVIRTLSPEDMRSRGFRELDYPLKKAVRKYLRHAGGVSAKAKAALKAVSIG